MEEWKVYPEFPTYEVSNNGRNRKRGNILKPHEDGYLGVCLCFEGRKYHRRINRIVAITFIPNPDNLEIADHIDKDRKNNCVLDGLILLEIIEIKFLTPKLIFVTKMGTY